MIEGKCEYCGKFFRRNRGRSRDAGRFCSRQCSRKFQRRENDKKRKIIQLKFLYLTCEFCGQKFLSIRKSKFCSEKCRAKATLEHGRRYWQQYARKQYARKQYADKKAFCKYCGKEFQLEYKKSKRYCSDECRRKQQRFNTRRNSKKRLRNKIIDSDITLAKLIERDNHICALCGGKVDLNDYSLDDNANFIVGNNYPSIDHIIPLSLGGLHSWDNIQLAHFICNRLKGATILDDTPLSPSKSLAHFG